MKNYRAKTGVALCAVLLTVALFVPHARGAPGAMELERRVVEHRMDNGMRLIILPRHQAPTLSLYMTVLAGAAEEPEGRSGLAHLLEHMLFKGTRRLGTTDFREESRIMRRIDEVAGRLDALLSEGNDAAEADGEEIGRLREELASLQSEQRRLVVKDEINAIYTRNGGQDFNAFTGADMTTYHVELPSNRLELWATIEADRMRNPVFREFFSERDVVLEERRQSYETQPRRLLMELLLGTAFTAHPYRRPVIGWTSDVRFLKRRDIEDFFRKHYSPDKTIVAAVGDVDPRVFINLMERYFGGIPPSGAEARRPTREPVQRGERRAFLEMDASPTLMIGYHKPTLPHRDDYVLDIVDGLLSSGRTSRLHRRLVEEEQVAVSVSTVNGLPGARYDNLFAFIATPRSPHTAVEVETLIYDELARLASEPPSLRELDKVRNGMKADFIRRLQSNDGLANTLSYFEAVAGDWRYVATHADVLDSVTPHEVSEVAARWFTPGNRTVVQLERPR